MRFLYEMHTFLRYIFGFVYEIVFGLNIIFVLKNYSYLIYGGWLRWAVDTAVYSVYIYIFLYYHIN